MRTTDQTSQNTYHAFLGGHSTISGGFNCNIPKYFPLKYDFRNSRVNDGTMKIMKFHPIDIILKPVFFFLLNICNLSVYAIDVIKIIAIDYSENRSAVCLMHELDSFIDWRAHFN